MRANGWVVIVAASLLLGACTGSRVTGPPVGVAPGHGAGKDAALVLKSDYNGRTATILAALMARHPELGFRVLTVGSDGLGVARGQFKFVLQPRILGEGKVNKLVVRQLYAVKDEFAGQPERLAELCVDANSAMGFQRASIQQTPQGPLFVAESELVFGDTLDLAHLGTYLDEIKHITLTKGAELLAAYLK